VIKALGRAFDWLQSVKAGQVSSASEIAVAENLTGSYVTRVLRLAFLAPNIVEAIITGTQPVELTLDRSLRGGTLPLTWPEQRRHLGFPTGSVVLPNSPTETSRQKTHRFALTWRSSYQVPLSNHSKPADKRVLSYFK
jgi:hypothetical protein